MPLNQVTNSVATAALENPVLEQIHWRTLGACESEMQLQMETEMNTLGPMRKAQLESHRQAMGCQL